ncbi:PepSY domain-containing protein [Pseudochrobactrum kiredjianiae]|uniref:PepSY domain-containing protein n=1 Tax=Pseudochrobactrum kiredjianiae TaxID=386305 RepID=A0ABW3V9A0_9HYPH|nr:PepSY domain-containing protein [Pseudochrobactrum kiredjianiae]MDM7851512.1 PepSY domain-containing protein [Pseudochrobactrum kiredjianiae]
MKTIIAATILTFTALSAYAAVPEGTKLSEIIAKIESTADVKYVDEVDWNDRGYYEVEYYLNSGAKVEIKIDPKTGEAVKN